jgi:NitT/TauT family transport system substrate-binding protein
MTWRNRTARTVAALAVAIGCYGAAVSAGTAADVKPLNPPQKVTVAYVPILKFATMYVAAERGLFEKYGLDVTFNRVRSGTEAIAFLTQGSVDVGGIAIVTSLWNAWNKGLDVRIVAPGALEPMKNSPTMFLVRKKLAEEGKVKSVADVKGMRVGVAGGPGSGSEYLVAKALEPAGLTIRDVDLVNVAQPDMAAAMANGSIDATLAGSPYADQMINAGDAKVLARDLTPGLMTVAFVASGKFIKERPEAASRFVLALTEAARMMQGKDYLAPENMKAYLTFTNSTEKAIRTGNPVIYDPNMVIPTKGLADIERVHRENGRTDYTKPIDLSKVVNDTFVAKAIDTLGKYKK